MSTQLSLVLSGVFCLILTSSAQEACRLDAAISVRNDENDLWMPFPFRSSKIYQIFTDYDRPGELIKKREFFINMIWRDWTEERITWAMTWFDEDNKQAVAIIGNLKTTHLIRFNEKNDYIFDTYKTWNKNSLVNLDVNGNSPSRAVFISHFQPGYLWMYHENTKSASWKLITIDSTGTVWSGGSSNSKNPEIKPWLKKIVASNLTIIGVLKRKRNLYCRGWIILDGCMVWGSWHIPEKIPYDWEESVVVFIEHDKQTWHCFGKFRYDLEECSTFKDFQKTNTSLFGCEKNGDLRSTTTSLTTIRTTKIGPPTDDRQRNGIDWTMMAIYSALIILIFVIGCCLFVSYSKEKDPHRYEEVSTKSPSTSRRPRSSGSISSESEGGKRKKKKKPKKKKTETFKPRLARDVMKEHFGL